MVENLCKFDARDLVQIWCARSRGQVWCTRCSPTESLERRATTSDHTCEVVIVSIVWRPFSSIPLHRGRRCTEKIAPKCLHFCRRTLSCGAFISPTKSRFSRSHWLRLSVVPMFFVPAVSFPTGWGRHLLTEMLSHQSFPGV